MMSLREGSGDCGMRDKKVKASPRKNKDNAKNIKYIYSSNSFPEVFLFLGSLHRDGPDGT